MKFNYLKIILFFLFLCIQSTASAAGINISSPSHNSIIEGEITLKAQISGKIFPKGDGVKRGEFIFTNASNISPVAAFPKDFLWRNIEAKFNTESYRGQKLTVILRVYSHAGKYIDSPAVSFTVKAIAPPADTIDPTINSINLSNGATVENDFLIAVEATDNVGVTLVDFLVDGVSIGTDNTSIYNKTFENVSAGDHTLVIKAYDAADNSATSDPIQFKLIKPDTIAPQVSITNPADGFSFSGTLVVTALATDNHAVAGVLVYINGELKTPIPLTSEPYVFSWNTLQPTNVPNGIYAIKVSAFDHANNLGDAIVNVVVNNRNPFPTPPPYIPTPPPVPPEPPALDPITEGLRNYFDNALTNWKWDVMHDSSGQVLSPNAYFDYLSRNTRFNSRNAYNLAEFIDGLISMHEATYPSTKDAKYLVQAKNLILNEIAQAELNNPNYPEWYRSSTNKTNNPVDDLTGALPFARLARIIKANAALNEAHGTDAEKILNFVDKFILKKFLIDRPFGDSPNGWTWMFDNLEYNPNNPEITGYWQGFQTMAARICQDVYAAGRTAPQYGNQTWNDLGVALAKVFKSKLTSLKNDPTPNQPDDPYVWEEGTYAFKDQRSQAILDTYHANREISFVLQFYHDQVLDPSTGQPIFTDYDIKRLSYTLTKLMWNRKTNFPSVSSGAKWFGKDSGYIWFTNFINGADTAVYMDNGDPALWNNRPEGTTSGTFDGWVRLGQYNSKAQEAMTGLWNLEKAYINSGGVKLMSAVMSTHFNNYARTLAKIGHMAKNVQLKKILTSE